MSITMPLISLASLWTLKQELSKNKERYENIQKFSEEARWLEQSEALQQARRKYKSNESQTVRTSEVSKDPYQKQ
ncbi:mitochondrial import inner membrane translocase subunit TIM44-like [Ictalurus furcatus]|uniref:mitochondrial import inner membrane translocase subunit TIM44-like n=1 Tax=Ictalurus furcatus TaxID=66913 RepID=UPI002350E289|nr:mitochondrial import inner membrane translocase subunit TIM44-like [Ictalurus furcatus]